MKLRATECRVDEERVEFSQDDALKIVHDSAYAHALMQALDEICNDCTGVIVGRANDIMSEWGFE